MDEPTIRLARDGGTPVRTTPLPSVMNATGRRFGDEEVKAVEGVLRSGMLSSTWGTEVPALEREFAALIGTKQAVACSSGTAALHLAVAAVNPEPGDEIITTPISDMGTVFPILLQNAVPVFADVDPVTGNLDPAAVAAAITPRTKAVLAVHLFGKPAPIHELRELCDRHGILLIEDCAQAYLAAAGDAFVGRIGHLGCFSLQQTKHISAGDGGLVVTDDPALARRMRLFADKGWPRDTNERTYLFLSLNYRMTELVGAVTRAQLARLQGVVDDRRTAAARATAGLSGLAGITPPPDNGDHVYWQYPLILDPAVAGDLHEWATALTAEGIPANGGYLTSPLYGAPALRDRVTYGASQYPLADVEYPPGLCPNAEELINRRLLVLPWNENYTESDVDDVVAAVRKVHAGLVTA
ncbi:dTDP-4-amino-4,6-dideoxygalactose transaminase [Kribbella amoyensis]|uniref:dTDP-4-amino-4,6-dideoxygalactose transaminase n=1 Tax=Kribbella amoyensis TaxID=996641 RepID=A0A561B2Y7_9ACTN|nr:DegT/DnrJ/EryC1/StrS family aminotransferase [Kribbella amoyensis]TWD73223.1 dTDP-4-amino-4,6-dideoxygalactose transaminase [Kribbella amoyensis]